MQIDPAALAESTLRLSTPLLFAALGGLLSERVGVVNIALEGMLLGGAFAGMAAAAATGNGWAGVAGAAACGAAIGWLHAMLVLRFRVDAIISGIGLNLLAAGLTVSLLRALYSHSAVGVRVKGPPPFFPWLNLPVAGPLLGGDTPLIPMAVLAVPAAAFLIYRTRHGLRLRAVGEAPEAAATMGIDLFRMRLLWVTAGGALAGLGGAYLSLVAAGRFSDNLSAGKGYLALAAVICGRWHPLGAAAAVLIFAGVDALQVSLQGVDLGGLRLSSELMSSLPYLAGLLALAGALGSIRPPAGLNRVDEGAAPSTQG